ncbi:hypothetical protein B0H10DRAFT_2197385 [Mycena sp. CBHHK59/15]|nr:hypothetical protein B0H10DRAFT_2197385 [Mycena sp. CBHHK59/15]
MSRSYASSPTSCKHHGTPTEWGPRSRIQQRAQARVGGKREDEQDTGSETNLKCPTPTTTTGAMAGVTVGANPGCKAHSYPPPPPISRQSHRRLATGSVGKWPPGATHSILFKLMSKRILIFDGSKELPARSPPVTPAQLGIAGLPCARRPFSGIACTQAAELSKKICYMPGSSRYWNAIYVAESGASDLLRTSALNFTSPPTPLLGVTVEKIECQRRASGNAKFWIFEMYSGVINRVSTRVHKK